jgi:hypothetical protein
MAIRGAQNTGKVQSGFKEDQWMLKIQVRERIDQRI